MATWFLVMILMAADGSFPRAPIMLSHPMAQAECQAKGAALVAQLTASRADLTAVGKLSFQCIDLKASV